MRLVRMVCKYEFGCSSFSFLLIRMFRLVSPHIRLLFVRILLISLHSPYIRCIWFVWIRFDLPEHIGSLTDPYACLSKQFKITRSPIRLFLFTSILFRRTLGTALLVPELTNRRSGQMAPLKFCNLIIKIIFFFEWYCPPLMTHNLWDSAETRLRIAWRSQRMIRAPLITSFGIFLVSNV